MEKKWSKFTQFAHEKAHAATTQSLHTRRLAPPTAGQLETTEQWTAGPIESEDEDADRRAAIQNTEPVEEDADVSEHVVTVPLTLREARGRALQLQ